MNNVPGINVLLRLLNVSKESILLLRSEKLINKIYYHNWTIKTVSASTPQNLKNLQISEVIDRLRLLLEVIDEVALHSHLRVHEVLDHEVHALEVQLGSQLK